MSAHVKPVRDFEITDPELLALVRECDDLGVPDPQFSRIVARVPEQARTMLATILHCYAQGGVDHRLKELVRIQMAHAVRDPYFSALRSRKALAAGLTEADVEAALGDYESEERFSAAEKLAMAFAEQMFLDSTKVDANFYAALKAHYTEPQIMELGTFIGIWQGVHLVGKTLGLTAPSG